MAKDSVDVVVKQTTTIVKGKGTLWSVDYEFRDRHGGWKKNTREIYDNGNSAVVLPYDSGRQTVLLTSQLRIPPFLHDGRESFIEACAGKLEGEEPEHRMISEIEEELGYRITELERVFELYISPGAYMEKITFFFCSYSLDRKVSEGGGLPDEGEDINVLDVGLQHAEALVASGEIADAKTVILLQLLRKRVGAL